MSAEKTTVQVFIAYSQKDKIFLEGLRTHIKPLERQGNVTVWFDGAIRPGEAWDAVIKAKLRSADIILALLSANSLASDYFYDQEIKEALERHEAGTARVVPVLLSSCLWQVTPLADLQGLPRGMKPISNWRTLDEGWHDVMLGLQEMVNEREQGAEVEISPPVGTLKATAPDEHAWEFTSDTNTRVAYQKYLERFPQGFYVEKARDFLAKYEGDETAWEFANHAGTDQAIQKYMRKYPDGLHWLEARNRLDPFYELMVPVTGGTFIMGDVFNEGQALEKPIHQVTLPDFLMCKYPVRQSQWMSVMGRDNNPSLFTGAENLPVEGVSWEMAQEFIALLNKKCGGQYRLPTEAEWEYAAREGGEKVRFGNGKDIANSGEMNFDASEKYKQPYSLVGTFLEKTRPVDSFKPNALRLYDMSGNVWEWCEDDWHDNYKDAPINGSAWVDNPRGAARVLRGGSWNEGAQRCCATFRGCNEPKFCSSHIGFRLVLSVL